MSLQSINLTDKLLNDYWQAHHVFDGESNYYNLPSYLNGMVSATGNGFYDPSNKQAIFDAIKANDPSGFNSIVNGYKDFFGHGSLTGTGPNDTLNYDYQDSGNDWFAPGAMLAAPFAGAALAGGWGGAAAGASAAGGGAFGLGDTALGLGGAASGIGSGASSLASLAETAPSGTTGGGMTLSNPWGAGNATDLASLAEGGLPANAGANVFDTVAPSASGFGASGAALPSGWQSMLGVDGAPTLGGVGGSAAAGLPSALTGGSGASTATTAAKAGTALSRLLDGTATAADYASLAGTVGSGLLGAYGASKQASNLKALSDQYIAMGAPSRSRYEGSFAPGFSMENDPGYKDALDQSSKATLHALSVNGNPAGSPNAWAASLKDNYDKTAYPALQNYRSQNAATSGIASFNAAAPDTQAASIGANGKILDSLGKTAADVFSPKQSFSLADLMKFYGGNTGSNVFATA